MHWTYSNMKNFTSSMWMKVTLLMCLRCNWWTCFPDCYRWAQIKLYSLSSVLGGFLSHHWQFSKPVVLKIHEGRQAHVGTSCAPLTQVTSKHYYLLIMVKMLLSSSGSQTLWLPVSNKWCYWIYMRAISLICSLCSKWKGITLRCSHFHLTTHMCSSH